MDKAEALKVMRVLKIAFPTFYRDYSADELEETAAMWATMLSDYSYTDVAHAIKATVATNKFPPTIAEVIEKIHSIHDHSMNELEAWGYINRALRDSAYHSREQWEKLPDGLKKMVSADNLRNWAVCGDDTAVIQSHFSRTFRAAQARQKEVDMLPSSVKAYMAEIGGGTDGLLGLPGQGDRALESKNGWRRDL